MVKAGWGRIVNVSSNVVGRPASMMGGNAHAATEAALEVHSRNLAAELDGTGVTVDVYWSGGVDTANALFSHLLGKTANGPASSGTSATPSPHE